MKNASFLSALFFVLSLSLSFGQTVGFHTDSQGRLLDDNGNEFIMKGINTPLTWHQWDVLNSIDDMKANLGINSLRIVVTDGSRWTATPENIWKEAVDRCIENEIIPILEVHDYTGNVGLNDPNKAAQWFAQHASYFNQPEIKEHILINITNEWGDFFKARADALNSSGGDWLTAYRTAITTLRNAGITTTLIIDATGFGQDIFTAKNIRDDAPAMMAHDAGLLGGTANLMFSLHMYCQWAPGGDHSDNASIVSTIKNNGIPILVGEFGYQHSENGSTCNIDEVYIMNTCESAGVGWLAWSQKGNTGSVWYLDLCNDWKCTSLSNWGSTVVNHANGTKSGETCSVFFNTIKPTISITSPSDGAIFEMPSSLTITATAADEDGTVQSVEFFNGTTSLGVDNSAPWSITLNNPGLGVYNITAVATDDSQTSNTSAAIEFTVSEVQCPSPELGDDLYICTNWAIDLNANVSIPNTTFSWQRNNSNIAGSTTIRNITTPGTYKVTTSKTGCTTVSDEIVVTSADVEVDDEFLCEAGVAVLSASGGTGGTFNWYNSPQTANIMETGNSFMPNVSNTTTYYVQEEGTVGSITVETIGQLNQVSNSTKWDITDFDTDDKQVKMVVTSTITLDAISVYPANNNTNVNIRIINEGSGQLAGSGSLTNAGTGKRRVPIDVELAPGTYIVDADGTSDKLYYDASSGNFPYEVSGMVSLDGNAPWVQEEGRYGLFYAWEFSYGDLIEKEVCDRVSVLVTVNPNDPACTTINSISELSATERLTAFPNPTSNSIEIEGDFSGTWTLFNTLGERISTGEEKTVHMEQLPAGVYHIKVDEELIRVVKQ